MITTLSVVTGTVFGVMTGVEFAVAAFTNPAVRRLPIGPALEFGAAGARTGGRVMPPWYIGTLLLTAWLAAVSWGGLAGGLAVASAALQVVIAVMSLAVLVPINNRIATWTPDSHPADWREQQRRWDGWHDARVAILVAAFVLMLVAGVVG